MAKAVVITGVLGGIGSQLAKTFKEKGYEVIGLDVKDSQPEYCDKFFKFNLNEYCANPEYKASIEATFDKEIPELFALINNAAVQILSNLDEITLQDWNQTLNVNLTGPLMLSQFFLKRLEKAKGSIINIASIHHQLTKKRFLAYASSKSALVGLTKALSVDLQGRVRVNAISPAAIDTQMLRDGFDNDEAKVQMLNELHPSQRIGKPREVSQLALLLAEDELGFINGANINIDGGISNVLKDLD
ncbi:NAD(P)-dependent dehydrogenase, short-chain alcohol dehydrogenase family [Mucilaginibacter gossypiicola]|uniref:NAD(P)-dependent dehydrogenase, short-chain alcohol dehydrogenase family n=1 Tax=Mucilaginibacter gossypiicola TaxID=551995 RepID=A0A1H8NAU2_9SPHI|nr:SDR family oxidoreductase [Mucilaginibacter gossypiicola]SEO26704.1 NAD(P)-dependent dehydrogenase, short-chain alcohol dehydrogenase family [Mucilaginibacter gossypiicola]